MRVVVVGGGLAGLTAAREIAHAHPQATVAVLEGSGRVGGALRREEVAGHLVDVGAESFLAVRPEAVHLVRSLGAETVLTEPATTAANIWTRGALHPLPRTVFGVPLDPRTAAGILTPAEIERALGERPWGSGPLTQDVSVGEYLRRTVGGGVVDRLVDPLLGGVYAGHADLLSLEATMPAVFAAAARGEGPGAAAAALPARHGAVFAGLVGGVGQLPELLADDLTRRGVQVRTGSLVRSVDRAGQAWQLVVGPTTAPEVLTADAVILAVPAAPASRLLAGCAPAAARELATIETASVGVITLAVDRAGLPDLPGSGFLVPAVDGQFIKASTFSSAKWAWTGALSQEVFLLRGSVGRAGEVADLQRPDDELVAGVIRDLELALGAALPRLVDAHVQRWGGALPQYAVGHVPRVARIRAGVAQAPGVAVCGASYDGVGIPAVIASARRAAAEISDHLRRWADHVEKDTR